MNSVTLGIDVSKAKLDAALYNGTTRKWRSTKAGNDRAGINKLRDWVPAKGGVALTDCRVVIEATGVYHEAVAVALHEAGCEVVIANPKRVRDYAKGKGLLSKTDRIDARVLARYGAEGDELQPWTPPPPEVRTLRALLGRLDAVTQELQREKNRWEKAQATDTPQAVRDSLQRALRTLHDEHNRLRRAIEDHYDQHPELKQDRERLQSTPGIGKASADRMLCLLKRHRFASARQAAACAGLVPIHHESGSSIHKRPRLSKQGDPRLRASLYMAAVVASQKNPPLRAIYQHLVQQGKSKMAALGAIMRRLIHIAYGILKHQTSFNPNLVSKNS